VKCPLSRQSLLRANSPSIRRIINGPEVTTR
jgi:hypothetical protein